MARGAIKPVGSTNIDSQLAGDSAYAVQLAALNRALQNFQQNQVLSADLANQDYSRGLEP